MAYYLGDTIVADTTGWRVPLASSQPASPVEGQVIYNTTTKRLEMYDSGYWIEVQDSNRPYLYRSIITTGYAAGGYANGTPWRNINRMVHATDVCTNLGDQLPEAAGYVSGGSSLTKGFIWGTSASHPGSSTTIGAFNMVTETNAGTGYGGLLAARDDAGSIFKEHYFGFIGAGGSGHVDVFNFTTEQAYAGNQGVDMGGSGNGTGLSDETKGYLFAAGASWQLTYATNQTYTLTDSAISGGSHQKGINSKVGKGYIGNESGYNAGYTLRRWTFATDTNIGNVNKPIGASGEENFDMGQDRQYMMGMYNGAQNNRGWRFAYSTDSGYELGAGSVRSGIVGSSSGHCFWKP